MESSLPVGGVLGPVTHSAYRPPVVNPQGVEDLMQRRREAVEAALHGDVASGIRFSNPSRRDVTRSGPRSGFFR